MTKKIKSFEQKRMERQILNLGTQLRPRGILGRDRVFHHILLHVCITKEENISECSCQEVLLGHMETQFLVFLKRFHIVFKREEEVEVIAPWGGVQA